MTVLVLALLWLAPAIRFRVELGAFSFALIEPVALAVASYLIIRAWGRRGKAALPVDSVTLTILAFFAWIIVVRPWGEDWRHGLSDIRDWAIPILAYIALILGVRQGWRKWALLFVLVGVFSAIVGIYQQLTDSFRPFITGAGHLKADFFASDEGLQFRVAAAVAFFEHPNSLAVYLIMALTIALGWLEEGGRRNRLLKLGCIACMGLALVWTYAKAELLVIVFMLFLFWLSRWIRSVAWFSVISICAFAAGSMLFWMAMNRFPAQFSSFWWRVDLWGQVFKTIAERPATLLVGNGDVLFATNPIWPQPHNVYFDALLNYGVLGALFVLTLAVILARYGLIAYRKGWLRRSPMLRAVWISLLTLFVTGFVESSLLSVETRMIFLCSVACFVRLLREVKAESGETIDRAAVAPDRQGSVDKAWLTPSA